MPASPSRCRSATERAGEYSTIIGVVYDPFCDELWTAARGAPARLNGKIIHVSRRKELAAAIVAIGFAKDAESLRENLPVFNALVRRVLKMRMMGSAALSLAYVASGRFDAYLESGIRIWDIAAAGFILERAGGDFWRQPIAGEHKYECWPTTDGCAGKWNAWRGKRAARGARRSEDRGWRMDLSEDGGSRMEDGKDMALYGFAGLQNESARSIILLTCRQHFATAHPVRSTAWR